MTISYDEVRVALETQFKDNWTDTPISWENAPIDIEEDEFVRFTIVWFGASNQTFGTTDTRKTGQIGVQIFVPRDVGSGAATRYADGVAAILENKQFGQILTYAASLTVVGEGMRRIKDVEYGYFQLNVAIPIDAQ